MFNLPFLRKQKQNPNKFISLSISSTDVKALLIYFDEDSTPNYKILNSAVEKLDLNEVRSGMIVNRSNISEKVGLLITQLNEDLEEKVDQVIIGVAGDLALGTITTAKATRHPHKSISSKELENLYKKIEDAAVLDAQNEYLEITGNADIELLPTTTSVVYTKVDNKVVKGNYEEISEQVTGENLEQAIFTSFTPAFHLDTLNSIAKDNKIKILAVGSEMYAILKALNETDKKRVDLILINIDTDFTEVTIVFGGGIVTTRTLNIGYEHFAEELSGEMGLTNHQAKKVIYSYASGELTQSESNVVKKCIRDVIVIWLNGLELLFAEFTGVRTFPMHIYVFGIGSLIPDVQQALSSTSWTKSIPFKDQPIYTKISANDFSHIQDSTGKIVATDWIKTLSLSMIHKELNQ